MRKKNLLVRLLGFFCDVAVALRLSESPGVVCIIVVCPRRVPVNPKPCGCIDRCLPAS